MKNTVDLYHFVRYYGVMDKNQLNQILYQLTENEKEYKKRKNAISNRIFTQSKKYIKGKEVYILSGEDLKQHNIAIRKDSRFSFMPFHTYLCININYIYSGQCTYFINDKEVCLHQGDICIFDKDTVRAKMLTGYNDIIINIVVSTDFFKNSISVMKDQNLLAKFVAKAMETNTKRDNYIIFTFNKNQKIIDLFDEILFEYYDTKPYSESVIQGYFSILMIELLRSYQQDRNSSFVQFSDIKSDTIYQIVSYIEKNYVNCTLNDLAEHFNYHEKYICSLLKNYYGKSFKEIQTESRMKYAERYLLHSSLSIYEIGQKVGFNNQNQFYKMFEKYYNQTPKQFRKNHENTSKKVL